MVTAISHRTGTGHALWLVSSTLSLFDISLTLMTSNDAIVTIPPPYSVTPHTLRLLASIAERLGEVNAAHLHHPPVFLERAHRVSSIHATLALEENPLGRHAIARLLEGVPARPGNTAELEVRNTIRLYDLMPQLKPFSGHDLRRAHSELMHGLALEPGTYRTGPMELPMDATGRVRRVEATNIPSLVEQLLHYAENDEAPLVITSCVLHFGLIQLQPFTVGNGRIARIWQKLVLAQQWPALAFLPMEGFIEQRGSEYHQTLQLAHEENDCGGFIDLIMECMDDALHELLMRERPVLGASERIAIFLLARKRSRFTRKDYRLMFPELSTATASRDLVEGVRTGKLLRTGTGRTAWYRPAEPAS